MAYTVSSPRFISVLTALVMAAAPRAADAAEFHVASATALQTALNSARGGDTVFLAPGNYVGNFKLPVHAGAGYVTVRTEDPFGRLPAPGTRITPAASPNLARLSSPNTIPVLRTAAGASYWRLELLEFATGSVPLITLIELGDGSSTQNTVSRVPHHLTLDRVYIHGDPAAGLKRGVALNSGDTSLLASYISDVKAVGVDSQAIAGWNGPGPYRIENNYLEAAGTGVLFGGDDPKIPYQVPTGITFRDNTVTRPLEWRSPILATPTGARASSVSGGVLPAGTYGYRVVARRMVGSTQVKSSAAAEVTVTVGKNSTAAIQWNAVPDASDYLVYGRTPAAPNRYWVVKGTSFRDDGLISATSGTPGSGTVWQVKNLFELKNARQVEIVHNRFSNNWAQAQTGTAILFTTRNQNGTCTWCVVEDITFEYNIVSGIGGGFQVTGFDNLQPSLQGNGFRIRHNVIADLSKSWGGKTYVATMTDGPRDVTFDHNTIISPDGSGIIMADGEQIRGFVFTNNIARHNTYGIFGSGQSIGNKTLSYYFPGSLVTRNVMAGGSAKVYPAGNLFPTISTFEAHFAGYAKGNYALLPGTDWQAAGTDGLDLGADMNKVAGAGDPATMTPFPTNPPLQFAPAPLPDATEGEPYAATLAATAGFTPYVWSLSGGSLPAGIFLDPVTGHLAGTAFVAGDYAFTVRVADATGTSVSQPMALRVLKAVPPVTIVTNSLETIVSNIPAAQALEAAGGLGTYTWSATGTLPAGVSVSPTGILGGTTTAEGLYQVTITAADAQDPRRYASQTFALYVGPAPNHAPTVTLSAPADGAVIPTNSTLTIAAIADDVDGNLSQISLYADDTFIASSAGPTLTMPWVVSTPGTHEFTVVATDSRSESTSESVTIRTTSEIVLYASDVSAMVGNYRLVSDATAAGGTALWNPDRAAGKVGSASASPASYAEFTFYAEAGRPYHLWIRGRGEKNYWGNDSAYIQFSGVASARIGTTSSYWYSVEEGTNAGIAGWGWEDNGWGMGAVGQHVVFETSGIQTLRIQPREDGLSVDQIVLSPQQFLTASPGALKNDTTILPR